MAVNLSGLKKKTSAIRERAKDAARWSTIKSLDTFVDDMEDTGPRDTNRYVRGWQIAALAAGGRSRIVLQVKPSRFAAINRERIENQVERLEREIESLTSRLHLWFDSRGRRYNQSAWATKARRLVYRKMDRLNRARRERELIEGDSGTFILIGQGKGRRLATVRTKVYGGTGRVWLREGRAIGQLRHLEPHIKLVEHRTQIVSRLRAAVAAREMFMSFMRRGT